MKQLYYIGYFLVGTLFLVGCEKGEEDPFISLRSREARLSGDWDVVNATWTSGDTTWTSDGENLIIERPGAAESKLPFTWDFTFEKDGTYISEQVFEYPDGFFEAGEPSFTQTQTIEGEWQFTGGSGDSKENSQLLLLPEIVSSQRSDDGSNINVSNTENQNTGEVYDMVKLSNKEMKLRYEVTYKTAFSSRVESANIELKKKEG